VHASLFQDSFCVNEEAYSEKMEASVLEQAEAVLEAKSKWKRRKRKRTRLCSASDYGEGTSGGNIKCDASRKRRRRIVTLESSDSDSNSQAVNKVSASCVERVQEQIPIRSPKIHTGIVNTNSALIDSECMYKKSSGCGALGESCVSTKKSVSKTEAVAVTDEWDCGDWNFHNLELPSFKKVCVEREREKRTVICDSNETREAKCIVPPRTFVSKVVRSLSAQFDKETIPTSVPGDSVPRQLACTDAGKSVLSPPESSIAGLPQEQHLKVLNTTVLEVSDTCSHCLCAFYVFNLYFLLRLWNEALVHCWKGWAHDPLGFFLGVIW
jgi:hypothetical protein